MKKTLNFFEKIWFIITNPNKFFDAIKKEKGILKAFVYFLIISVLIKGLWRVPKTEISKYPLILQNLANTPYLGAWTLYLPIQIIGIFIVVWILHYIASLFGSKETYSSTFKVMVYVGTPHALLGWIFPGLFAIWSIVLNIIGFKRIHKLSTKGAVGVLVIGFIIAILITFVIMKVLGA
tara:strand:- start:106 stop:642 length:537 start_codon:yes stop_codon:yes gene_type:complete